MALVSSVVYFVGGAHCGYIGAMTNMSEPKKVLVAGDFHGNLRWAELVIQFAERSKCGAVVQLGDFGAWTPGSVTTCYLDGIQAACQAQEIHLYWLDGNHEDHSRRHEFSEADTDWFTYLPRGHRWSWWGRRFMSVGGAVSVDKKRRTEGKSWWPEEILTEEEAQYAARDDGTSVDVVFAHDCPAGVLIPGISDTGGWPQDVLLEDQSHRNKMLYIWENTRPQLWIHGHYHVWYNYTLGGTRFTGLGCDGDRMANAVKILHPDDLM